MQVPNIYMHHLDQKSYTGDMIDLFLIRFWFKTGKGWYGIWFRGRGSIWTKINRHEFLVLYIKKKFYISKLHEDIWDMWCSFAFFHVFHYNYKHTHQFIKTPEYLMNVKNNSFWTQIIFRMMGKIVTWFHQIKYH